MPTVLIIDDDKHTRALLRTIFEQDGRFTRHQLKVIEAGDGIEGLSRFEDESPAIVVTDLQMPRLDGFGLCEAIRNHPKGKEVGLIVVTGAYRDPTIAERVRHQYRALYFAKPYELRELAAAVDQLVREPGQRPSTMVAVQQAAPAAEAAESGDLAGTPLPRLLLDLWEKRVTGALTITRAGLEKRIDLVVGHPVSVSSNQRDETLGEFLVARGQLTPAQHQRALRRAHDQGEKLGEALVELGFMSAAGLVKALTQQARAKIVSALRWKDGSWSYQPNRDLLDRHKGNALDPAAVVLLGLKQTGNLDLAIGVVDEIGGRPLAFTPRGEKLRATITRAFGEAMVTALARPASVAMILEVWPDAAAVMQALEALLVTGCVQPTVGERTATGSPAVVAPAPAKAPDPIALAGLSQKAGKKPPPAPPTKPSPKGAGTIVVGAVPAFDPKRPAGAPAAPPAAAPPAAAPSATTPAPAPPPPPPPAPPPSADGGELYEVFFGEGEEATIVPAAESGAPEPSPPSSGVPTFIADDEESGVIEVTEGEGDSGAPTVESTRERLLAEYLRVQGHDLYAVLEISPDASDAEIRAAYQARLFDFSLESFAAWDLGGDHAKLEEIHAAYRRALDVLTDPARRAEHDARRGTPVGAAPALASELAYHEGQKKLADGDIDGALPFLLQAAANQPGAADYQATLGWARWLGSDGGKDTAALEAATACFRRALEIDPDHPGAHELYGRVLVDVGHPGQAATHLERALAAHPPRLAALPALERARGAAKQWGQVERVYRLLIHRLGDADPATVGLWLGLSALYRNHLGDESAALTALTAAARLAPDDPRVPGAVEELTRGHKDQWSLREGALRALWRLRPEEPDAARQLLAGALEAGQHDLAFVVAALLSVRDPEHAPAVSTYRRQRPRFLARAWERPLALAQHPALRHEADDPELAELFALLEELATRVAPVPLAQLAVGEADRADESSLPEAFRRVRAWVAEVLAVPAPPVYVRKDFDDQAHVAVPSTGPVLLCGPAALKKDDRVRLGFDLARTMTYLWPGRGVAASRPARRLRSMLLGCLSASGLGAGVAQVPLPADDDVAGEARAWMLAAPESRRTDVSRVLARVTAGKTSLNLSAWVQAMGRTADRVGLVLCADPAVALRGAEAAGGADAQRDLLAWARGPEHLELRVALGRSIEV